MGITNWGWIWTIIMPLAVILYYFFRKKYKDRPVSSTLFWQETMKEIQASPYLKKLQHHLLFYLQLAALLLCVFGLLQPYINSDTLKGNEFIFVVDTSATMLAGSPSNFDKQKEKMLELLEQTGGKPVTIVLTGQSPEVIARDQRNMETLEQAIEQLKVIYENAHMEQTLLFAETLVDNESTVIHVFTDALDRKVLANKTDLAYEVHGMEGQLRNVSIRQFGLTQTEEGMKAIVQVINESEDSLTGAIRLSTGEFAKEAAIELKGKEEILVPFEELPEEKLWTATLDINDEYSADNEMTTFVQQPINTVFIDSSLHELVASGFRSLDLKVTSVASNQLDQRKGAPIVTNQTALANEGAPILLIGRNDAAAVEVAGQIETADHPLFTYAPLDGVYVSHLYPGFDSFETIASIDGKPFIQLSSEGDIVILADIQSTDWPLSPSFPLFLWSAANELAGSESFLGFFQPNEHRSVTLASSSGEWEIFKDGEYMHSYLEGQGPFAAPAEPGVYDVKGDSQNLKMIVQLSNEEKAIAAGADYQIGQAVSKEETVRFSIMPPILIFILILLLVEWEVYRRGIALR
ncbi:BatA and WFA domain-containing protein [Planococcus shenhongbingii]|uniref:vWA domain-containing protein n=1 Tax=Planococcus shenhongbingii TaxID=3058398 RepID=UPI00260DD606|nr:BatA and WFA domain-containing protein [Planococcus sp. N016]WKA57507.1 BatA and WFA domain-containing protein [Planococcus sp. N016]